MSARPGRSAQTALIFSVVGLVFLAATARGPSWQELIATCIRAAFWLGVIAVSARLGAALTGSRLSGLSHLLWDGAAGLPIMVVSWLVVGLIPGGFSRLPILAVLAAFVAIALVIARREGSWRLREETSEPTGVLGALAIALVVSIAVLGLAWDRVPPVFYDTLTYHWAQPDLWIIERRIAPVTWSIHSGYPPGMSVLYGIGLALGGERLANDANLTVGLLLLGLAWDLGRRRAGPIGGFASLGILASFPIVIHAMGIAGADLGHGLFVAGTLGALVVSRGSEDPSWRRRAAWLAAGAVLTKFLGLVMPLALGAAWMFMGRDVAAWLRIRRAATFILPALMLFLPWCVANWMVTGNPVAPAGSTLIPTTGLAEGGSDAFRADARGEPLTAGELRVLVPRLFGGEGADSPFYPVPAWGLMPVVLLLALPLAQRNDRGFDLLALAGISFAFWIASYRWERFLIATTFLMAVALGGMLASIWRRGGVLRLATLLAVLVGVAAGIGSIGRVSAFTGGGKVFLGREDAREFLERSFAPARVVGRASERLDPSTTRILFVGEMRHYGIKLARTAPTGFNLHPLVGILESATDPAAARTELLRLGYTHLLIAPAWIERSGRAYPSLASIVASPGRFQAFMQSLGPPIEADAGVLLFAIAP